MSAEIIQFGKPERRTIVRPWLIDEDGLPVLPRRVRRRSNAQHIEKTRVRFMFEDELYEAEFYDSDLQRVCALQYRINTTGVEEMRRIRWEVGSRRFDLDPALGQAARRAHETGSDIDASASQVAAALAQLQKRREKLARMVEQVDRAIADLQQHISN